MKITKNTVDVVAPNTLSQPRKHSSAEVFCQLENIVGLKMKRCNSIIFP